MSDFKQTHEVEPQQAAVGVFDDPEKAAAAAVQLRDLGIAMQRVSRKDSTAANELPEIVYQDVERVAEADVGKGMLAGGAVGAGSGLLFIGVPGLNIAAPIAGALAGAWIGGIAGIDEANRAKDLPDESDYQQMMSEGKSFVVIPGDERERIEYSSQLKSLGAIEVNQHPPVKHVIHSA